jgi:rhodanese-related sulfurtransferase
MNFLSQLFGMGAADTTDLSEIIKDGAVLVDVRTPLEFQGGSVKGAINIPLDEIKNHITKLKNKKAIVVFCRSGARSAQAKAILERNGVTNVYNGGPWTRVNQLIKKFYI